MKKLSITKITISSYKRSHQNAQLANLVTMFSQNHLQTVMIGFAVSTWLEMRGCVPQGAMLLFLIMISYVHSVDTTINYIDDSTLCV